MEFKNFNPSKPYKAFLYKRENGETISKLFVGEDATKQAVEDGWELSPSVFVDEQLKESGIEATDEQKEQIKTVADTLQSDLLVLLNCDSIDDAARLRESYNAIAESNGLKKLHGRTKIKSIRQACKDILGGLDVNE